MTRRTTRIAALGAGSLLSIGILSAAPAGASDGAKADATAQVGTADAINQTLGLVNQACVDAGRVGDAAASALTSEQGIAVAANQGGNALNLNVSLPALTRSLPSLDSLPLLGSLVGHVDAAQPLKITCATSADGSGLGLSAAGVDVLVDAIAPGVDVSGLDINIPSVAASGSATTSGSAVPGTTAVSATAAGSLPATRASAAPSRRASAAAPAATTTTSAAADVTPATTSSSPSVSAGSLARTGAGVGALGLLGSLLIGGGRLLAFGRKFLRVG